MEQAKLEMSVCCLAGDVKRLLVLEAIGGREGLVEEEDEEQEEEEREKGEEEEEDLPVKWKTESKMI